MQSLTYMTKTFLIQSHELAQLVQHFKFLASCFVLNFNNYVFTHAVGGLFDRFLAKLYKITSTSVFESIEDLIDLHSEALDEILGACLLRSGLKSTAKYLHNILDTILHAGLLIHDLYRGCISEVSATTKIKPLLASFIHNKNSLVCFFLENDSF